MENEKTESNELAIIVRNSVIDALCQHEETKAKAQLEIYSEIVMPFGKYEGERFDNIPLRYLDETISKMERSWISDQAVKYVHMCMCFCYNSLGDHMLRIPSKSFKEVYREIVDDIGLEATVPLPPTRLSSNR